MLLFFSALQTLNSINDLPNSWRRRTTTTSERKKSAEELGVPECKSNFDCVTSGVCVKDRTGKGRCFCSSSCPLMVPVQCENNHFSCESMGDSYMSKYDMRSPLCYHKRCICPPQFDPQFVLPPAPGFNARLPTKCDKRELRVVFAATPSNSVSIGSVAYLFCCINVDPRTFIPEDGVVFIQNDTIRREPTRTPYESFSREIDTYFSVPTCWGLGINNVQSSDSGTYKCIVQPGNARYRVVSATMEFDVKKLRTIRNITIVPDNTSLIITWEEDNGPALQIDMQLYKASSMQTIEIKKNVKSPIVFVQLSPATSYKLNVNVTEGQNEPFRIIELVQTTDERPYPPLLEGIGVMDAEDGSGGKLCEIKWRPPDSGASRDQIKRYYVQISGRIRYVSPESKEPPLDHYPQGVGLCANGEQNGRQYVDSDNLRTFFACKYGPLKPNRNYTATVWAENKAGLSTAASVNSQCVMDFAQPGRIEPPSVVSRPNVSSFGLRFDREPEQENGPIVCYYLAILPLPLNVSVEMLPMPENVTMDTFDRALKNNQNQYATNNKQFFAYIAESYLQYPKQTVVGDRDTSAGIEPCNVHYLTRYTPSDSALIPELKYTGFLIARVDRDLHSFEHTGQTSSLLVPNRSGRHIKYVVKPTRWRRQLTNLDPAYGFSDYFKPVALKVGGTGGISPLEIFLISLFMLIFLVLSTSVVVYFMHKRGMVKRFCCITKKSSHDLLRPGIPPSPIRSDDLPAEYILKHRDSDYQFAQEFEMLPRGKNLDHTISERKENARKNRYNDIKACDATRVRLRRVPGDPNSSDYINANFIKGYKGRKCFIATQGPLECTIGDFWRMIWEQGSRMIIMVTSLRERGRDQCVKYWPDEDEPPLIFRTLEIAPADSAYYADYTVRAFEMSDTEPPPQPARSNGRVNSAGEKSLCSATTGNNIPFDESGHLAGNSPSPPPSLPLIQAAKADPMNSSAFSIQSRSSHDRVHSTIQRRRHDSEYANIASIIRPQSKSSGRMSVAEGRERRRVLQFHFTSWNDYKAPECTIALLKLLYKLRKMDEFNHSPVVVHCSAGVGRTGTLVAIDYVMDQMLDLGIADVFTCVAEMRQQRNLMVQSVEQYVFIYKALAEFQLFGDTDMTIAAFRRHFSRLHQPLQTLRERHLSLGGVSSRSSSVQLGEEHSRQRTASITQREKEGVGAALRIRLRLLRDGSVNAAVGGQSMPMQNGGATAGAKAHRARNQLELEFQDLSITLEKPKSTEWAHKEENALLNRCLEAVPFNFNRLVLHPMIGYENTYINASLVKGYFYPYILAQDTMGPETVFDFWRMINDQQSYTIVMLSTEQDFLPHELYWPREVSKRLIFGKNNELAITLAEEIVQSGFVQRKLHYRFKQSDKTIAASGRDVLQFSFLQWKSCAPTPNSPSALLDLIGRVLERQSNIPDAGPIVLHCRDGSAENGVFACVSLLLERLRSEHLVDVFRTVKALQLQRPLLFSKIEQYAYCYECVMEYLNTCK
uniref:protein-tyrosine-phosphatase n=1 Tax=Globodera rostochiensis TaxID=31243 RepID=A0A914HQ12_GLORO